MGADMDTIHGTEFRKHIVTLRVCWYSSQNSTGSLASQWESFFIWLHVHVLNNAAEECAKVLFKLQTTADSQE